MDSVPPPPRPPRGPRALVALDSPSSAYVPTPRGRVPVRLTRVNGRTFIEFLPANAEPTGGERARGALRAGSETAMNVLDTGMQIVAGDDLPDGGGGNDDGDGDGASIWSASGADEEVAADVDAPRKPQQAAGGRSIKARLQAVLNVTAFSWLVVVYFFGTVVYQVYTTASMDGSLSGTLAFVLAYKASQEVALLAAPAVLGVCASPWPFVGLVAIAFGSSVVVFPFFFTNPYWTNAFSIFTLGGIVVYGILLPFCPRIHAYAIGLHRKGLLLASSVAAARSWFVLVIPAIIKSVYNARALTADGAIVLPGLLRSQFPPYTMFFAIFSVCTNLYVQVKLNEYPRAKSTMDLVGIMRWREFVPLAFCASGFLLFLIPYVCFLSDIVISDVGTWSLYVLSAIVFVFVIAHLFAIATDFYPLRVVTFAW